MPSFTLPDHVTVDPDTLQAIAKQHGLDGTSVERLPDTGIFNAIYRLGQDAILRVPRNHPDFVAHGYREAGAVPGRSWGERPLPMLLEVLRFFLDPPDDRWRAVGPIESLPASLQAMSSPTGSRGAAHV